MKTLEAASLVFSRSPDGLLRLSLDKAEAVSVRLRPLFPLTRPDTWIVVMKDAETADKEEEIGVLQNLEGLSALTQDLIREELSRSFFMPQIRSVQKVEVALGVMTWTVETSVGPRVFRVPDRDQIRFLAGGKILVRDDNNDRYLIENFNALDRASQDALEVEL